MMTPTSAYQVHVRSTLFACIAVFARGQFQRAAGGVFGPVLSERLDILATALGALVGAMFAATLAAQAPAGIALDRFGPRRVMIWALGLVATGTALFAIAPALETSAWPALLIARVLTGAGLAATGAGVQMALAQNLPANDYGYASGLLVTLGGIGGLFGTWPLAVALERLPWVVVFGVGACLAVMVMVIVWAFLSSVPAKNVNENESAESLRSLLRNQRLRRILVLGAVTYAPIVTITGLWGGPYVSGAPVTRAWRNSSAIAR